MVAPFPPERGSSDGSGSELARRLNCFLEGYQSHFQLSIRALHAQAGGDESYSSFRRWVDGETSWSLAAAWRVTRWLAADIGVPFPVLWTYLAEDLIPADHPLSEILLGRAWHQTRQNAAGFWHSIKRSLVHIDRCICWGMLPYFLVPERLIPKFVDSLGRRNAVSQRNARAERFLAQQARNHFLSNPQLHCDVILDESYLNTASDRASPLENFEPEDLNELLESILKDALEPGGVTIGFVSISQTSTCDIKPYELVASVGNQRIFKRLAGSFGRVVYERSDDPLVRQRIAFEARKLARIAAQAERPAGVRETVDRLRDYLAM